MLLLTILMTTTFSHATCANKYQYIHGKKMMSNCAWNEHVQRKTVKVQTSKLNFGRTYLAESNYRFDAVNRNDSGKGMSLGIVQFNSKYARIISKQLGIKPWMSTREIKRRLRTSKSKQLQLRLFNKAFVNPVLRFTKRKGITNKRVIEFLVDWRVNGMPKKYYKRINKDTTLRQLVSMRNARYKRLHRKAPRRYTRTVLKHWLKRSNSFLV